jgi:peptide/nickel transport system ATP-binding protein
MKPILELQELTAGFEQDGEWVNVLRSITFSLGENEILGIVGETGSGKSVLARAIMGLLPGNGRIRGGDIRFRGNSLVDLKASEYRKIRGSKIGLIATNPKALLDPVERVGNQIARVLREHRGVQWDLAKHAAVDLLAKVGIRDPAERAESYPHQLSGGMAQRVIIAMALVAEPQVLLADDATLGLDATVQVQVLDMMVERGRQLGLSVILITHDLGMVAHYCDRVAIMRGGQIVELKPVSRFLAAPESEYSRELLESAKPKDSEADMPGLEVRSKSAQPDSILAVQQLTKIFATPILDRFVRAVDDVSFSIDRGETLALVGESGSGKTTIGQCLVRLLAPNSGKIIFDGQDITNWTEGQFRPLRRRIQIVFQEPYLALNPRWRVFDLIAEPLRLLLYQDREKITARVHAVLEIVKLPISLARVFPNELTAGEQKRLGIARALATEPDLVIFDEPTTALDIRVRAQIIELVRELQSRTRLSALYITHDLNSVRSLAHRVAVMNRGRIVETGPTAQVFSQPEQPYTKTLLAAELPIERPARSEIAQYEYNHE